MNSFSRRLLLAVAAALAATACQKEEARVSLQPKDSPPGATAGASSTDESAPPPPVAERPHPHITWTLPAGWEEAPPGQMSEASFRVKGDGGQATINITPLPNLAGKEALLVNMWREQVGAAPLSSEEAAQALSEVEIAGGKGKLFEVSGSSDGKPVRIVTAISQAPTTSWFYKLSGDDALVAAQKPAFLDFIKSVRMEEPSPSDKTAATP